MRYLYTLFFLTQLFASRAQSVSISGHIQDTIAKTPLQYAVVMATKLSDSTLVAFTRSDQNGVFKLEKLPLDTYQVVISHPGFGDQYFIALGSLAYQDFDFGRIILPPKSVDMKEVVIYAYKDPVYFKGDTLIYTADSFKVKQNATVEDLLKKLPGIKVDADGKITSQGKAVDQVLVDGDEFFGTDPTIATRNLGANAVESVQVYDKKNENAGDNGSETIKVMDLKLKEDAKKGYFGKLSAAADGQTFYEGELLASKFKGKQKISVFALGSNTPKSSFNWDEINKYGLNNEMQYWQDEDDTWYSMGNDNSGIPRTLKSGIYYSDKISSRTKLNFDYTFRSALLNALTTQTSQYFLSDTTYKTTQINRSTQQNNTHSINFSISQKLDSLTELELQPKVNLTGANDNNSELTDFISAAGLLSRNTNVLNSNSSKVNDLKGSAKLTRKFRKKGRQLVLNYNYTQVNTDNKGFLISANTFADISYGINSSIDQQKLKQSNSLSHYTAAVYTEPLTPKFKLEFSYDYTLNQGLQQKKTLDFAGGSYSVENKTLSNKFENNRKAQRGGIKLIYEVKKMTCSAGTKVRNIGISNINLISGQTIKQEVNNVLPFMSFSYKFSDNQRLYIRYQTGSKIPDLNQLQPVPDNTNPNQVVLGNPNLQPSFSQDINVNYNTFKPLSSRYLWTGVSFSTVNNAITTTVSYDSIGRSISEPLNVNGNYNAYLYGGGQIPLLSRKLTLNPQINAGYRNNISYINREKNITTEASGTFGLDLQLEKEKIQAAIGANYSYNNPVSTLNNQSNKPYSSQQYTGSFKLNLPKNFSLESDGNYTINSRRSNGYNINYFILNASMNKIFLKKENLIISLVANDILNQNISANRSVDFNVITDTKTTIIRRYFLLKAVWKFNSNKAKEDEDDF